MSADPDAYATLHVAPDTPAEVISALYRALARRLHPDGPTPDLPRMTEVNRAYHLIKTPELRRQYDAARTVVAMGPGPAVSPAPAGAPARSRVPALAQPSHERRAVSTRDRALPARRAWSGLEDGVPRLRRDTFESVTFPVEQGLPRQRRAPLEARAWR